MSIVITGATGQLGRLIINDLLATGVPAADITAAVRSKEKAEDLTAGGIQLLIADYDKPETWTFTPEDRVLLISSSEIGRRVPQHTAVINAAKAAGVAQFAYTSVFGGPDSDFALAEEHQVTERLILDSGLPYTFLRNNWYSEMYTDRIGSFVEHGSIVNGVTPDGRIATAPRADYAAAAAVVLTTDGHLGKAYELSGDTAWTFGEFAAQLSAQTGKQITHTTITAEENKELLTSVGIPAPVAEIYAGIDDAISRGVLSGTPGELSRLIGRPAEPIAESIARAATVHPLS